MPSNATCGATCAIYPANHPSLPAPEYSHHTVTSPTTGAVQEIATIESIDDTAFEIKLQISPTACSSLLQSSQQSHRCLPQLQQDDYLIFVCLDGISVKRCKRHRTQTGPVAFSSVFSSDLKTSRAIQFGKLQLVDPDENNGICQDDKIIQDLGTIQVNVVRCVLSPPKPVPEVKHGMKPHANRAGRRNPMAIQTTNQMIFSERSKKASQLNTVGLGKPMPANAHPSFHKKGVRHIMHQDPHPFLQFIFKYKPRSALEDEGILAPPSPSPPRVISPASKAKKTHQRCVKTGTSSAKKNKHKDGQQVEKKTNSKTKEYIFIDSDSSTDSLEDDTKQKAAKSTQYYGGNNGSNSKTKQNRSSGSSKNKWGEDENHPQLVDDFPSNFQQKGESKKRNKPATTDHHPRNKRRSSITADRNVNGGALKRDVRINREVEETDDSDSDDSLDDDIEIPEPIVVSARARVPDPIVVSARARFPEPIVVSARARVPEASSSNESNNRSQKLQDQGIGSSSARAHVLGKRPKDTNHSQRKKVEVTEETTRRKKAHPPLPTDSGRGRTTTATTSNIQGRNRIKKGLETKNPWNFVDLTQIDSD